MSEKSDELVIILEEAPAVKGEALAVEEESRPVN